MLNDRRIPCVATCARNIFRLASLVGLVLALGGCGDDEPLAPDDGLGRGPATDTTSPAVLIAAHEFAIAHRDLARYTALLEAPQGRSTGFRYIPLEEDAKEFAWIPEGGWNYDVELGIIGNMMGPEFLSPETGYSIDSIEIRLVVLDAETMEGGGARVTCSADMVTLWAESRGTTSVVRFVFELFPDGDGFLRIRTITELPGFVGRATSIETMSWGSVKALYHD